MNNQASLEHVERKTFLLAEQMQQLQEYATEFREESKRTASSQEESTSQLRVLQDEVNQQANEIQSRRSELVREEARLQQSEKRLQEEKSAWAATQKYVVSENADSSTTEYLQTHEEIEQQIEDWKLQVEKQNEIHLSRKIAFEKRLSSMAQWEESLVRREEKADAQGEKLSEYETKLALQEHELASSKESTSVEKQEDLSEKTPPLDNELDINFGTLFEEKTPKKEEEKKEDANGVRSALADMFDLSADQLAKKNKPVEDQNKEVKTKPPQMMEVELESARFMSMKTESPKVAGASEESEPVKGEKTAEDENSVSAYMERLLARTRNGSQEPAPSQPIAKTAPEVTTPLNNEEPLEELPEEVEEEEVSTEPKHKQDREEVRMQRDSLRELANYSARTDIAKYTTNQMHLQLILKYVLTGVSFMVAGALLTSQMWAKESYFSAGLVALGVFAVMGMELLRSLLLVRRVNSVDGNSVAAKTPHLDEPAITKET